MDSRTELSAFLKSRRARLTPADVGLPDYGSTRRVAGLRREELARIAGVSVAHYTRLEQGNTRSVSSSVLDAISRALRLDAHETAYVHRLARHRPGKAVVETYAPPRVRPALQHLLDSMEHTPGLIIGHHADVVAWNRAAAALFADFAALPPQRRDFSHLHFFDEEFRALHGAGWREVAHAHVAHLRALTSRAPVCPDLLAHVDRMRRDSAEFRALWADRDVVVVSHRIFRLRHPLVGALELEAERVELPGDCHLTGMDLFTAAPGSPTDAALRRLAASTDRRASAS
uniref:helix-turn-helix domain-containing protein n=1 Tax=Streptomyces polyasparticus TaxID=2767826 RepID=UPI00280B6725|nr:helix-turn-helix domain-containing protein [Streptomyces polyasparticus]